jgi:RNA polymerase sigma factor (sigma-70 family)
MSPSTNSTNPVQYESTPWNDEWAEKGYVLAFTRLRYRFPGCDDKIQDAVQSAFRKALATKTPNDFPDLPRFARWITTTANNELIDVLRKTRYTAQSTTFDEIDIQQPQEINSGLSDEAIALLSESLKELAVESRLILTLYYFEGLNDESISKRLNISPATAWRRRRDALANLRRQLLLAGLDPVTWDLTPLAEQGGPLPSE